MATFLRVLQTRWHRGSFAYKMAAFLKVLLTRRRRRRFDRNSHENPYNYILHNSPRDNSAHDINKLCCALVAY